MKLLLQSLRLKNFKGMTAFSLNPGGSDIRISGENETGKTSIVDAFYWLLFGKDSTGSAKFQIKPVNPDGTERHHLETEVEAEISLNGTSLILMRRFKEKYTKKRGEAQKSFTGHTTDFFIDEVPAKEKDFLNKVASIIEINTFKMVTSPYEFNNLPWVKRRDILMEMCGDTTDQEVIDSDKSLSKLPGLLAGCSVGDHKKKVKAKKTDINKELEQIPIRISEQSTSIQDVVAPDPKKITSRESQIDTQREKLRKLKSNELLSEKQARLNEVNSEISKATGNAQDQASEKKGPINEAIDELDNQRRDINGRIHALQADIAQDEKRNKTTSSSLITLRAGWKAIKTEQPSIKTDCPTCGQGLPDDKIESAHENFNKENARKLENNQSEGKRLKQVSVSMIEMIEKAKSKVDGLSTQLPGIESLIKAKEKELKAVYFPVDVKDLDNEKDILESEIRGMKNGSLTQQRGCTEKITELQADISELQKQDAAFQASETSRARIEELETQEKTLAEAFEKLESELFLIEQFIIRKVEMVEDQVNGAFKMATFKLFKTQINGGIEECCETLHKGVPYNHGLNSAARINVGLDIISTLSDFYGFQAPIFIDNSESVNEIITMDAQVISLAVSFDKKLIIS